MGKTTAICALVAIALASAVSNSASAAAPCRDGNGKFIKCAAAPAAAVADKCRSIATKKFAKCGAPGTEPVPKAAAAAKPAAPAVAAKAAVKAR